IGRNGVLLYGETEPEIRSTDEDVDQKGSHRLEEDSRKWEGQLTGNRKSPTRFSPRTITGSYSKCCAFVAPAVRPASLQPGTVLVLQPHDEKPLQRVPPLPHPLPHSLPPPAAVSKPRYEPQPRKPSPNTGHKGAPGAAAAAAGQEGEFPCKKCGRIFYKVKSRSAHMKSHAEQEKKAAAQRQREAEERARAAAALMVQRHNGTAQRQTGGGDSTNEDSTDTEDQDDRDWS
ncbi:hypothetical protein WMY93_016462, partial [Mugilogobius chulae]